jgi:hypothetical protein
MRTQWNETTLLEAWGLRQTGGLRSPLKVSTGGGSGSDDEAQAMRWVEAVPGFESARPVLAHVYVKGLPVESYIVRGPGEPLLRALLRHGWGELLGTPERKVARTVLVWFMRCVAVQLRAVPFEPVRELEDEIAA